jgi:hypothetical protein
VAYDIVIKRLFSSEGANCVILSGWEINPDCFSLGEHWQAYVNSILTIVCKDLGVHSDGISAELHKMLLYEQRAIVKPHENDKSVNTAGMNEKPVKVDELKKFSSEKVPGVFATLVVSLPSAHWGSAVVVSHGGQQHSLQTQGHEYLAW